MQTYSIHNPTKALCVFFDGRRSVSIRGGDTITGQAVPAPILTAVVRTWPELVFTRLETAPFVVTDKPPLRINGMNGLGDCLHQRSVVRELMKIRDVWLATCHWRMYEDLIADGLKLVFQPTRLRAQAKTIERERSLFTAAPPVPIGTHEIKLWYKKEAIDRYGSILQAMHGNCDVLVPEPDFSLPVPQAWRDQLDAKVKIDTGGKKLLVLRPIVIRREWNSRNRNPDPIAYQTLYEEARAGFYTVSVADLLPPEEMIEGPELPADLKLHRGELTFEEMAALWRRADLVFANAGFGPVLAQAVGTPSIVVYGGRESFTTTDSAGQHLAPTLGIDPIKACDCHTERHDCGSKAIDMPVALDRVRAFVDKEAVKPDSVAPPNVLKATSEAPLRPGSAGVHRGNSTLIFATTYADCRERQLLTEQWITLHTALNPEADFLIVDSASPTALVGPDFVMPPRVEIFNFGDNVGHLSRGGKDGWGRAFCKGLDLAVERGYEHVLHIEGDSLLRVPAARLIEGLTKSRKGCGSIIVRGMKRDFGNWLETGLMLFTTDYLRRSKFTAQYNWPIRTVRPTPELVVFGLVGSQFHPLPLDGRRADKNDIHHDTVVSMNLDWITHCHTDIDCYARFLEANMPKGGAEPASEVASIDLKASDPKVLIVEPNGGLKLNLGCGTNKLPGWENHDSDVDITKPLPWPNHSADFVFIEHCVEHVSYHQAIGFFEEAYRVLRPGGVLRVVVPSIEQIRTMGDQAYFDFAAKWSNDPTLKGAQKAILFSHGHQQAWTASLMAESLLYAGFSMVWPREVGQSDFAALRGAEGHGLVIGDAFNRIESMAFEAVKGGQSADMGAVAARQSADMRVAVVVGGAANVWDEIAKTKALLGDRTAQWVVINDMIPLFADPCIAVTLHATKIGGWIDARRKAGRPEPSQIWCHVRNNPKDSQVITNTTEDWRGSSGLFAVKIARQLGFERIILCGVPMQAQAGHVVRGPSAPWTAVAQFMSGWHAHKAELMPCVRSWSGWTAEVFGAPDEAFLISLRRAA